MKTKSFIIIVILVIVTCLYTGWSIGYNDGMITAVAMGRPHMGYKTTLKTTIQAERSKTEILKLRLTGHMGDWRDRD